MTRVDREDVMGLRIGIDVGEKSLGLAAVDYNDDGWPVRVLAAVAHIHDGGMDPDTAKSPQSRLATAGVARRTRRLFRNRRRRLNRLDAVLTEYGIPVPDGEVTQTHDAWYARALLSTTRIDDQDQRGDLLALALRHMARHRGWRNPWWSFERLAQAPSPSPALEDTITAARNRFGIDTVDSPTTLGQLVAAVASTGAAIRPIKGASEKGAVPAVLGPQVKQQDTLAEARLILTTQGFDEPAIDAISRALMYAAKPTIPKERIGPCALIPELPRASSATLEFQEYRVRAAVANLRIRPEGRRLTEDEHDRVVEFLLNWDQPERPRWRDVADLLDIRVRSLAQPSIDQEGGGPVPVDRTSQTILLKAKKNSVLGKWWRTANQSDRAEFVDYVTDLSGSQDEPASAAVAELLADQTGTVGEAIEALELESGRTAYSREALTRLLVVMREERCDVHTARRQAFNLPDDWTPPAPTFDDDVEHPTVARINSLVRRFMITATDRWGPPEAVVIEHVRGGFMGPTGLAELKREITANTTRRDKVKKDLVDQGLDNPSNTDLRRNECLQRQNSQCLYCGTAIGMTTSELDHIVPRAGGGSSRRDNLVAVCRPCNKAKGRLPFAVFANNNANPLISLDAALDRVKAWQTVPGMNARQLARLKKDVIHRLNLREDDDSSEQSLESTAFAARQMRARIQSFLAANGGNPSGVHAYAGAVTSEARKAGGIDDMLRLRDFTKKSRFDRRHHAIDAAVLTCLRPAVAKTLKTRTNLQAEHRYTGKYPTWRDFKGAQPGDVANFDAWHARSVALAQLLKERIDADRVPVVRPLRLTPRIGSLHADTVDKLTQAQLTGPFTHTMILRIVNPRLYTALLSLNPWSVSGCDLGPVI
ncbi:MAG: HNH endonuclease [Candidatus Nanopelagicales bacterium]|nr:HNH endonuclease [Candidatus Nanopelagicales bacterium]